MYLIISAYCVDIENTKCTEPPALSEDVLSETTLCLLNNKQMI